MNTHFALHVATSRSCADNDDDRTMCCMVVSRIVGVVVGVAATHKLFQDLVAMENMVPLPEIAVKTDSIDTETVVDGGVCILTDRNMASTVLLASIHRQCFAVAKHLQKCQITKKCIKICQMLMNYLLEGKRV